MRRFVRITAALSLLVFPAIASAQDVVLPPASARVAGKWVIAPDATAPEILELMEQYLDAWRVVRAAGTAIAYAGNTGGATKGGARIDYIFYSRGASRLALTQARVFDITQPNGVSPSDHRPASPSSRSGDGIGEREATGNRDGTIEEYEQ